MNNRLAVDVGASSGRMILGNLSPNRGQVKTEEIHRFDNGMVWRYGQLCWDFERILSEITAGIDKCAENGKSPLSVGIDTWGVDFVLLDAAGNMLGNPVAYRDKRTAGMREAVHAVIPEEELYERTGIQSQPFNTVYQLMAVKRTQPELLEKAAHFLLVPDYLHYRLCGAVSNEYTNATTTGLVNAKTRGWDLGIIGRLGLPARLFKELTQPGTEIGRLRGREHIAVIAPATHDTASAVMAAKDDAIYISSGTWSLMGIKRDEADTSTASRAAGFTNEGGYGGQIRYLKNIMGLWMIQSVKKELDGAYNYDELCEAAEQAEIESVVDCGDERFFSPASMTDEIKKACAENNLRVPNTPGQLAKTVYQSLAHCYAKTAAQLEELTGKTYDTINIIGGGAKAEYLNRLTALHTGKKIITGPIEATSYGNLTAQDRSANP
ncbi:MAG: rhamnulokinase [Defluviitaleaceae bacterium]|nr:rhamnulokinase [Defluviitaleaceae bacterium]